MNQVTGVIRSGLASALGKHLSGKTKRMVFLASLSARLKSDSKKEIGQFADDDETLAKLNEVMALAHSTSATKLPVVLSKVIWQGQALEQIALEDVRTSKPFTKERLQQISARVLDAMPSWLRYDSDPVIERDVTKLLQHRGLVLGH
jgi:hypothetical protein